MVRVFSFFCYPDMMMNGIILKATPYEEDGKIIQVFTQEAGLISVLVKKLARRATFWQTATSPLTRGEFHLIRRHSDLYILQEISLTDAYYPIRAQLDRLDAACTILHTILLSQYPEKPSLALYALTITYLKKLKTFSNPLLLALSFQMKLLNHEGLFPEAKEECSAPLSEEEWLTLECLCHAKQFDLLESLTITPALQEKSLALFSSRITDYN